MLRFMGLQRVRHDWATELNWTETTNLNINLNQDSWIRETRKFRGGRNRLGSWELVGILCCLLRRAANSCEARLSFLYELALTNFIFFFLPYITPLQFGFFFPFLSKYPLGGLITQRIAKCFFCTDFIIWLVILFVYFSTSWRNWTFFFRVREALKLEATKRPHLNNFLYWVKVEGQSRKTMSKIQVLDIISKAWVQASVCQTYYFYKLWINKNWIR